MQTFLPYPNFDECANVLDTKRLGKQRVECLQILNVLVKSRESTIDPITGRTLAWLNHPVTQMWKGYEQLLATYSIAICEEWIRLGYNDTCLDKIFKIADTFNPDDYPLAIPPWLGNEKLHSSHRATLLFKDYEWYSQFGWTESPKYGYEWNVT